MQIEFLIPDNECGTLNNVHIARRINRTTQWPRNYFGKKPIKAVPEDSMVVSFTCGLRNEATASGRLSINTRGLMCTISIHDIADEEYPENHPLRTMLEMEVHYFLCHIMAA
jgi:hypothetical protein